ncbi:hypothetical protein, conserved [Babesia ovata]|uniref:Extracellular matrix-binding ebh n=1 Tax=Babesia ovata TaxID=189622 RepID=A0A2H6KKC9_9APIC|nr:uncharacterized protein BOVATA_049320 [Babesia ovata]GBE63439.1 hypothetical protein, conserved [Babesia ovata]
MTEKITKTLNALRETVKQNICDRVNGVVNFLKEKVKGILTKLLEVKHSLGQYIKALQKWMKQAKEFIEQNPQMKVNEILKEVKDPAEPNRDRKNLEDTIKNVDETLKKKVEELGAWKDAAGKVVQAAQGKCDAIVKKVGSSGGDAVIFTQAQDMSTKAESLRQAAESVKRDIGGWVQGATDKVTELETYLRSSLYKKREEMKTQIKTYITKQIQAIVDAAGKATSSNGVDVSGGQAALQGVAELGGNFKKWVTELTKQAALEDILFSLQYNLKKHNNKVLPTVDEQNVLVKALFTDLGGKVDEGLPNGGRGPSEQINLMDTLGEYRDKKQTLTGAITTIGSNVTQNLDGTCSENSGIIGDKNTFQQPFSQIKEQLTAIAGLVDSDQTKPDPPTKKTGVKNYLTDLEKMLTEQPNYPLTTQLDKTYTVQGLALIKTDIEALQRTLFPS